MTPGAGNGVIRVLGLDPGSRIAGFGVVEQQGNRVQYVASGCIRTGQGEMMARLRVLFEEVRELVESYAPDELAVESVFVHRNAGSALKLGQARGAALAPALAAGIEIHEYTPTFIKQAIVGTGNAAKAQIQHMVSVLLNLPGHPQADAADALAVALCHCQTVRTRRSWKEAAL